MTESLGRFWQRFGTLFAVLLLVGGVYVAGVATMYWIGRSERMQLVDRFPVVRAAERASCEAQYQTQVDGLERLNSQNMQSLHDLKAQMDDTHEVVAYTLRFLGDRAKLNDRRTSAVLQQARAAANAASEAAQKSAQVEQKTAQVEQKVSAAVTKADEAASTAKAVDKKLDTATRPPLPAKPWAGFR